MAVQLEDALELLSETPWWIAAIVAVIAYMVLGYVVPSLDISNVFIRGLASAGPTIAPVAGVILGFVSLVSSIRRWYRRRLFDSRSSAEGIRSLDWRDFERLVGEAFRRQGYSLRERGGNGPDGGVDLELKGGSGTVLVQCKHWKAWKVGVRPVRELFGVMVSERADEGIVVTSGRFTAKAHAFARSNGVRLLDGPKLVELIQTVRANEPVTSASIQASTLISFVVPVVLIAGILWLGKPSVPQQSNLIEKSAVVPAKTTRTSQTERAAAKSQEREPRIQRMQLAAKARNQFKSEYVAPEGCDNWKSKEKMVECANDRIRARRMFVQQHPEYSAVSESEL